MATIYKGTWTLNPTFPTEINPPINISIKLDNYSGFSYKQEEQDIEVWLRYYLDMSIAAQQLNEDGATPSIYISGGTVTEEQTISDNDLATLHKLGFSFYSESSNGWMEGMPFIKTENGWKDATAYIKTDNGWQSLAAFYKKS